MLTMINVAQEYISPQELLEAEKEKEEAKRRKLERKEQKRLEKINKKAI